MASLYGGKKGQDFYPARIFENKVAADANIASVNYNDIILIDYGFINSDNYTENLKIDGGINYSGTFWQKNYNTTNNIAEYKYLSALKFDVTKKIEFLPIVYRTEDNFNLEAYNNLLENQI